MSRDPENDEIQFWAANPWPLAALAKEKGFPTDQFRESDMVPEGIVLIIDPKAIFSPPKDPYP